MTKALLELFRTLASFEPRRVDLSSAPWDAYVDWAIGQGLGPMAAYNLEYRLGSCGAPQWARDRLLAVFQGTANDNVMKLVNFKRVVGELEGRRIVLLGAAAYVDGLYPHVAFRPVVDLRCLVAAPELDALARFLARGGFEVDPSGRDAAKAERVLSDQRTTIFLHGGLHGRAELERELLGRATPARAMGPSIFRLEPEDALLVEAILMARCGFEGPMVGFVDVRELVGGAPALGGTYARSLRAEELLARASAWRAERALWVVLGVVERLFPEMASQVARLRPALSLPVREILDRLIVGPVAEVGRGSVFRGEEAVRALLVGG